jgi:DHA1 family bicyclomycin/chloramphenicol resistance-like MFS transporter
MNVLNGIKTMDTTIKISQTSHQRIATLSALVLIPLSGFATDIYIPSLPQMATSLQVSTIQAQLTLSLFLITYGISQLFIGGILDSFGRHKPIFGALVIFAFSCLVICFTHNIYLIYLMRVVHGITIAVIIVAKRAYFVDVFTGAELKNYLGLFTIIWSTGPIIAPFIGGYLQSIFGWQSNFYFLAAFALIMAFTEYAFGGETLKETTIFSFNRITSIYKNMIGTTSFSLGLVMTGLAGSMMMVYNMSGPFIIEHQLRLSPIIAGYCSLILGLAWMIGGFIGKATVNKPFLTRLFVNAGLQTFFVAAMVLSLGWVANLYTLVFFAFAIHVSAGYIYNNFFAYNMTRFPKNAGIAGGLSGGVAYIIMSVMSYSIVYGLPPKDERNLSYGYLFLVLLAVITTILFYRASKHDQARIQSVN